MSDPVEASRSMLNPNDAALAQMRGQPQGNDQPIGQWLESMGVKWEDPKSLALQKIKEQAMNATPMGKMNSIAQKSGGSPGMGAPAMGPPPQMPPQGAEAQPRGLMGLVGR